MYGTISGSLAKERQRSVSTSYNRPLYDNLQQVRSKVLQDELRGDRLRTFDHGSTLLKNEINKKLGNDLFDIKLSNHRYDPMAHQSRQRPLEENIKRLKETAE